MQRVIENMTDVYFSISTTSRTKREGEVDGVDYHFVSKESFKQDIQDDVFLEWAKVHDNYYGTSLKPILKALHKGKIVIFDIDVQGHKIAKEKFGNLITSVFITTPSQKILRSRLESRGTDAPESIEKRLNNAVSEMTRIREYDYLLINDNFEDTLQKLTSIVISSRVQIRAIDSEDFISSWIEADSQEIMV